MGRVPQTATGERRDGQRYRLSSRLLTGAAVLH
jgi:hypothetical protein